MLHTRLEMTPTEINDLFASMLAKLDPLHCESFHFYLEVMKFSEKYAWFMQPRVAQITAAQLGDDLLNMSYEDFLQACDMERLRIVSRSSGLLQIYEDPLHYERVGCVAIPQLTDHGGTPSTHIDSARDAAKLREPMDLSVINAEAHMCADRERLGWIHRSAHDFIFPPDGPVPHVWKSEFVFADACDRYLRGALRLLAVSPSIWSESIPGLP
ncbi:uncharacterized protein MYCFIDRAFT_204390, partial [Pseudocercospora fijiensis CIRAD86]